MALTDLLSFLSLRASSFKNEALRRLLSFNSSDNQGSANLENAPPPEPQLSTTPAETIIPIAPLEIERVSPSPSSTTTTTTTDTTQEDFRKEVQTAAPFLATISFGLLMKPLASTQPQLLIIAHDTCVYLSLFLAGGLLMHSIFKPASPEAARSQKKVMAIAVLLVFLAVVLHISAAFPIAALACSFGAKGP